MFDDEKERIIMHILKTKQVQPLIVKKLKKLKDECRDAVIKRYMLKCRISHCEKFFEWRESYHKLTLD